MSWSSSSSGSSTDGTDVGSVKRYSNNSADTCAWYGGGVCGMPRTCHDCLNVLLRDEKCGIDTDGQCVSLGTSGADSSADVLMSSSSVATYCDPHESVCQNCKDTVCMGSDGCVCMAMCQVSSWEEHVLQVDGCIGSSASGSNGMTTSTIANTLPVILMIGLAGFVLFGGTILVIRRLPRNTAQVPVSRPRRTRRPPREMLTGPALALSAWREDRGKLENVDQTQIHGLVSPAIEGGAPTTPVTDSPRTLPARWLS